MNVINELRECLALQNEIAAKRLALKERFKAVIEAERQRGNNGTITVLIDGAYCELHKMDGKMPDYAVELADARKVRGF
jgi:hypothetical protein